MRRAPQPHRHPKELDKGKEDDSFTGFNIKDEPSDLKIVHRTELEDRAKQIRLSRVPIVAAEKGRVRVARNNQKSLDQPLSDTVTNKSRSTNSPTRTTDHSGLGNRFPKYSPPKVLCAEDVNAENTQSWNQPIFADSKSPSRYNYFAQPKTAGKTYDQYDYKPPAAAKYFLWDPARTGLTHILKTENVVFQNVRTTTIALKNMRMELLKRHLISSQTNHQFSQEAGFLLGKSEMNNILSLVIDRFDCGIGTPMNPDDSRPSCKVEGDVVIRVLNQENIKDVSFHNIIQDVLKGTEQPPLFDVHTPFPIYAYVVFTPNEMDYFPKFYSIIPFFTLEIYPVHPIRIVNTELSFKLVAGLKETEFGYISIDQARQLFLLENNDPLSFKIPLVGMSLDIGRDSLLNETDNDIESVETEAVTQEAVTQEAVQIDLEAVHEPTIEPETADVILPSEPKGFEELLVTQQKKTDLEEIPHVNQQVISPVEHAQQMYISLLEQQVINLQNQLITMGQSLHSQKCQIKENQEKCQAKKQDLTVQTEPLQTKVQAISAVPDTRTIGVNTDITFNPIDSGTLILTKENLGSSNGGEKLTVPSELESDLKNLNFPSITLPSDNGNNFVPVYQNAITDSAKEKMLLENNPQQQEGKDIITNLVNNPEQSFIYTDLDTEAGSDNSVINLPKKSRNQRFYLPRNEMVSEGISFPMDLSETDEKSYSFATMNYLSKYGLNNL
ncbi:hypothetical protein HDV06_001628 [Boothiomyces sp. JEL0866]|nr:hypothetical protein HDV06_001628 [Boothiomyces sp. JEL0866]